MLTRAIVGEERLHPFPKGRGICPTCGAIVIAKCGTIKTHHWAHESRDDCDSWSESVGPWHLAWQQLVNDQHVEVTIGEHRADVVGNAGIVVELQHSSIPPEEINERENFYGNMVWVFDATGRFPCVPCGDRVFFSFGNTKHIEFCRKPVFLDCGSHIVEVGAFAKTFNKFSGYGWLRDQSWFANRFLSDVIRPDIALDTLSAGRLAADRWQGKQPWRLTDNPSRWRDPTTGCVYTLPAKSLYLPMNYKWNKSDGCVWSDVIRDQDGLANGWTESELTDMKRLLNGMPMILNGRLRVMPSPANQMQVEHTVSTIQQWIGKADAHMQAGRIPLIKSGTFEALVDQAKKREIEMYGKLLKPQLNPAPQPTLF